MSDAKTTIKNEWYTPKPFIEKARSVFGGTITLDPASCEIANRIVEAKFYYTESDNGLSHPWVGNVWLNPPYSGHGVIASFVDKLVEELFRKNINQAIVLVDNRTDTQWFKNLMQYADRVCFTTGRIRFWKHVRKNTLAGMKEMFVPDVSPKQGQAFFYFGNNTDAFHREFRDVGCLAKPIASIFI